MNGKLAKLTPEPKYKLNTIGFFGGAQSSAFLPTDVSGLKCWLKADTGITKDGSDLVSNWADQSGNSNDVAQPTATNQPLWVDSVQNGLPIIRFDGVDNFMWRNTFTSGTLTAPNTIFVVCKFISIADKYIFDSHDVSNRNYYSSKVTTNNHVMGAGSELTVGGEDTTNILLYSLFYNGASTVLRRSKSTILSGTLTNADMGGINLATSFNDLNFGNPDIAEMLIYNKALSDSERDEVETYLTDKWAV